MKNTKFIECKTWDEFVNAVPFVSKDFVEVYTFKVQERILWRGMAEEVAEEVEGSYVLEGNV